MNGNQTVGEFVSDKPSQNPLSKAAIRLYELCGDMAGTDRTLACSEFYVEIFNALKPLLTDCREAARYAERHAQSFCAMQQQKKLIDLIQRLDEILPTAEPQPPRQKCERCRGTTKRVAGIYTVDCDYCCGTGFQPDNNNVKQVR